jgi:LacI family transcriptional regulator
MTGTAVRRRGTTALRTRATLTDVARQAGVSLATASRALNGTSGRAVGDGLRERVLAAARELDYSPDANAQAMARGRTATIGLIVHDIADPYFSSIAAGITAAADEGGYAVTLANTHHDPVRELHFVQTLQSQRARAIILAGGRQDDDEANDLLRAALRRYRERGGTVAMIGQPILGVSTVRVDNVGASAGLATALHALGYRRFGLLAGPERHLTARERTTGFLGALADLGVEVPPAAVLHSDFTRAGGYSALGPLLERAPDLELVFAVNDVMAVGAMSAARDAGLAVPGALAFAGFDDISTAHDVNPALTTVHLPLEEMGRLATPLALDAGAEPRDVVVTGRVVVRDSTPALSR